MTSPYPVIVTGRNGAVATIVIEGLKPEIEAIHVCLSVEAGKSEIPLLLNGQKASLDSGLGSANYGRPPTAVITGAGYTDDDVKEIMQACGGLEKNVPWLRPDLAKHGDGAGRPVQKPNPEYIKTIAVRAKKTFLAMMEKGKMTGGEFVMY